MQLLIYTSIQRMNATNSELRLKSPFWKVSAGNNPFLRDLCEQKVMPSTRPAERSRSGPAADRDSQACWMMAPSGPTTAAHSIDSSWCG